jgi:hypothetical protein
MPESRPVQIIPISSAAAAGQAARSQAIDKSGFKSPHGTSSAPGEQSISRGDASALDPNDTADFASDRPAIAERRQRPGGNLRRSGVDLLPSLPLDDAVRLAALVGTGQAHWADVHAALAALIKLATSEALKGYRLDMPSQPDEPWIASHDWNEAMQRGEGEVWARYNAKCDEAFADDDDPFERGPRALERMFKRERILDRLRAARDAELAELMQRLGPPPAAAASQCLTHYQRAVLRVQLTASEADAMTKLHALGFTASTGMMQVIRDFAGSMADHIARAARTSAA